MKKFALLLLPLLLVACSGKQQEMSFTSEDQSVSITISGNKTSALAPFKTNINLKGYGHNEDLGLEIYASNLNEESVQINWKSNTQGAIIFTQQDNTSRILVFDISEERIQMKEGNSTDETIHDLL